MGNIDIKPSVIMEQAEVQKDIASKIGNIVTGLEKIQKSIINMQEYQMVGSILDNIVKEVRKEQKNVDGMGETLKTIASMYIQTEEKIVDMGLQIEKKILKKDKAAVCALKEEAEKEKFIITSVNGGELVFHIGEPSQPEWEVNKQYDNDFAYNPDATASWEDRLNWIKWKTLNEGAEHAGWVLGRDMPDAIMTYEHYRANSGEDLEIDYAKAYNQDNNIKKAVDGYLCDTQKLVEKMLSEGQQPPFSITSELMPVGGGNYPETENWQKAIGAHQIWISADITVDENGRINMSSTVHEIDRYNFNAGMQDIASGASDNENGRFEELGWAKSFNTKGEVKFELSWETGNIDSSTSQKIEKPSER